MCFWSCHLKKKALELGFLSAGLALGQTCLYSVPTGDSCTEVSVKQAAVEITHQLNFSSFHSPLSHPTLAVSHFEGLDGLGIAMAVVGFRMFI